MATWICGKTHSPWKYSHGLYITKAIPAAIDLDLFVYMVMQPRGLRIFAMFGLISWIDVFPLPLIVQPRPTQYRSQRHTCHIILEQGRIGEQAAVVLTALLEGFTNDGILQGAFSILARTNLPALIQRMDIATFCAGRRCSAIFNQRTFLNDEWFDLVSGQSARIRIEQPLPDTVDHDIEQLHFEDLALLQRPASDAWPRPPQGEPDRDQHISVELSPAILAFEWFDAHFLLPAYILPEPVIIPVVSTAWLQLPLWEPQMGGQNIWVYFDGSFQPVTGKAGIGIAIYVRRVFSQHRFLMPVPTLQNCMRL